MARLGVFGGSFDPPHLGHLHLAQAALAGLHLDRVLWVLTPDPPHKHGVRLTAVALREQMVLAAIAGKPGLELSRIELERPGPHYMVDTLSQLKERLPGQERVLLIGGDSLRDLPTWGRPQELVRLCTLAVMHRPGAAPDMTALETLLPGITARTQFVQAPLEEVSSSEIRERVRHGEPFRHLVPPGVAEIIDAAGLYRDR